MDERMIKSPKHYTEGRKFEPKDVIRDWGLGFNLGSAVKYISRAGRKGDTIQDLKKAQEFIQFEIDALEAEYVHLCNSCAYECIAGCPAEESDITFGNGVGGDNIVKCMRYCKKAVDLLPYFVEMLEAEVKPIMVKLPDGIDIDKVMEEFKTKGIAGLEIGEPEPTDFQRRAVKLYNAYLYSLSRITKEMQEKRKSAPPMLGICSKFVQEITLKEGFEPEEVLEHMAEKLMEE